MQGTKFSVHIFRIFLNDLKPEIWRRVAVLSFFTLHDLHQVIQAAMPWTNAHCHLFTVGKARFAPVGPETGAGVQDESKAYLHQLFPAVRATAEYVYDLGDDWRHGIFVEDISVAKKDIQYPACLGGERACPPEDCGGPDGFLEYLESTRAMAHPQKQAMLAWKKDFDPALFMAEEANCRLRLVHPL